MNQIGRIKLMSKKLTASEMNKLSMWFKEKAMARSKEERINEIISLGLGGRVVYVASNREYDVTGVTGSIVDIKKKRNDTYNHIDVKFDRPVYKRTYTVDTQEFLNWKHKKMENKDFYKEIKAKYSSLKAKTLRWEHWIQEEYHFETGKNPVEVKVREGDTLIHVSPFMLKPATEENMAAAQRVRDMQPMYNQLNKAISGQLNEA